MYGKILGMGISRATGRFNLPRYTLLAAGLFGASSVARADFYLESWKDFHEETRSLSIAADLNFYSTKQNFDNSGKIDSPPELTSYGRIQTDVTAVYGFSDRITGFARLTWQRVDVSSQVLNGSSYGLGDQTLGLNARLYQKSTRDRELPSSLDLQLQADLPAYSNTSARSAALPFLGDGSVDVTAGIFGTLPVLSGEETLITLTAGTGITIRNAGFSSALPYSLAFGLRPRVRGIVVNAAVTGFQTLQSDSQGGLGSNFTGGDSQNTGGSHISNAVNPSLTRMRGEIGWQLSPNSTFSVSVDSAIRGANAPAGTDVALGFMTRFPGVDTENDEPASRDGVGANEHGNLKHPAVLRRSEHPDKGFVSYNLEARVIRVNDRLNLVKLDKGAKDHVETGQFFDLFSVREDGEVKDVIARGKVTAVAEEETALEVTEYFRESWINEKFIAKRVVE